MTDIKIAIKGNRATLLNNIDLIAGTIGQKCILFFDKEWDSYISKTITYKVGPTIIGSYKIDLSNEVIIPQQVLMTAGLPLEIGITGHSIDGSSVRPTSWCLIGKIQQGAVINNQNIEDDYVYDGGDTDSGEDSSNKDIIYDGGGV